MWSPKNVNFTWDNGATKRLRTDDEIQQIIHQHYDMYAHTSSGGPGMFSPQ